jgi:TRAP-type C4-dicarboxylate transport system permease small subunit
MRGFWKLVENMSATLRVAGICCLMGMTLLTCVDVVGRKFNHPVPGSVELVGFMATLAVALALPYTHRARAHIGVEILVRFFSEKVQTMIDLCMSVVAFVLFAVVTWQMVLYAWTIQLSGTVSMSLELPEHLLIYCTALCFLVFTLNILRDIVEFAGRLRGGS